MATATHSDEAQTYRFDTDAETGTDADIYVTQTFESRYGQVKAELGGDTYDILSSDGDDVASAVDWDTAHLTFDKQRNAWTVDVGGLDHLAHKLDMAGYAIEQRPPEDRREGALFELHDDAEEGDDITVTYEQKNGEGTNQKAGEICAVDYNSGYEDKPLVAFRRHDDDHYMYVQFDNADRAVLYTGKSHSPFVGEVEEVRLEAQT